jgi:hypothetical protein
MLNRKFLKIEIVEHEEVSFSTLSFYRFVGIPQSVCHRYIERLTYDHVKFACVGLEELNEMGGVFVT